jgi:predicted DNA-binding transcriptional regulator YafY
VVIAYIDASGIPSEHAVRPLVLEFWGRVWTLANWCEARQDFRSFRVDRIKALRPTGETFLDESGTTLADWRRLHGS